MNRKEEILHQQIAEAWNNSHLPIHGTQIYTDRQRLICNWTNSESGRSGNKARTMGVKKGIADWGYMKDTGRMCWIELKIESGKQSKEQLEFQLLCERLDHEYHICRDYYIFWQILGIHPPFKLEELQTK